MKSFDYYAEQCSAIGLIEGFDVKSLIKTDEWVHKFYGSISAIRTNTQEMYAQKFHHEINKPKIHADHNKSETNIKELNLLEDIYKFISENPEKYPHAYQNIKAFLPDDESHITQKSDNNRYYKTDYGRINRDNGRKTALDAVSILEPVLPNKSDKRTLYSTDIERLHEKIKDNKFTFEDVKSVAKTLQDLKIIRQLALNGITGLMSDHPDAGLFLEYLSRTRDKMIDIKWASIHQNDPQKQLDHGAYRDCARRVFSDLFSSLSNAEKEKMLENVEGTFGQRLRGVVEFAAEKVGQMKKKT